MNKVGGNRNVRLLNVTASVGNLFFDRAIWIIYLAQQGFSLFHIGLLQSILHATMFLFEIPTGVIADLVGRRVSLLIGRSLTVLYLVGMMFASELWTVAGCFFIFGLGLTFISGAEEALLYDSIKGEVGEEETAATRHLGRYMALITISLAVAMLAGGVMKDVSWKLVYGLSALFQVASVVCCFLLTEIRATEKVERQTVASHLRETLTFFRSNRAGRVIIIGTALYSGVVSTYYMFSQDLFSGLGFSVAMVSALFAVESLLSAGISANAHVLEGRFGAKRVLLYTLAASLALFPLVGLQSQLAGVGAFYAINLLYNLVVPLASSAVNNEIPSEQRASLLSVMSFTTSLVMLIVFPVIGYLADVIRVNMVLSTVGSVSMLVCLISILTFYSTIRKGRTSREIATVTPPAD